VFGKTLVMTPPAMSLSTSRTGASHGGELGVVSEVEADIESSLLQEGASSSSSSSSRSSSQSREGADNLALHNAQTIAAGANV
jgi:hypothetical protein